MIISLQLVIPPTLPSIHLMWFFHTCFRTNLAYNRHSSGFGTLMLLGSACSKKAFLVYLLCHGCTRGVVFWCFEQLGHAKRIGDKFQQDLSDNCGSTPYLLGSGGWAESTPKCPFLFAIHVADCMMVISSNYYPNALISISRYLVTQAFR
jgi:hypothetical protein